MARLKQNFTIGNISNNPLTAGATTINSAEFTNLPVVTAPDIMVLVLDPLKTAGQPEIVHVTAHTNGAASVTVSRGQENSGAREHVNGTRWIHTVTAEDLSSVEVANGTVAAPSIRFGSDSDTGFYYDADGIHYTEDGVDQGRIFTGSGTKVTVGLIQPPAPNVGDLWVDTNGGGDEGLLVTNSKARLTVSTTAPSAPVAGDLWVELV